MIHRIQIYTLQLCMECYLLEKSLQVVFQITAYGNLLALYWLTFYKLKCVFSQKSGCWWSRWVSAWQDILRLSGESINTNVGTVKMHNHQFWISLIYFSSLYLGRILRNLTLLKKKECAMGLGMTGYLTVEWGEHKH